MGLDIERILSGQGVPLAVIIRSPGEFSGVNFVTDPDDPLQVGLMKRGESSPVKRHRHLSTPRELSVTAEFLFIMEGKAHVVLDDEYGNEVARRTLGPGDAILLFRGGHAVEFTNDTRLMEVKQGPFSPEQDKVLY